MEAQYSVKSMFHCPSALPEIKKIYNNYSLEMYESFEIPQVSVQINMLQ
jgi:hypothetical protein